jgi:hypothetical protein
MPRWITVTYRGSLRSPATTNAICSPAARTVQAGSRAGSSVGRCARVARCTTWTAAPESRISMSGRSTPRSLAANRSRTAGTSAEISVRRSLGDTLTTTRGGTPDAAST